MYTVKVLKSENFDNLPFRRSKEALGVADPETNTAYIRFSAIPELNRYLIDHEFEHLIEKVPTDEEDGVRYKLLGDMFGKAGSALGSAAGGIGNFFGNFGSSFNSGGGSGMGPALGGLGLLAGSQLIRNPKPPQLPQSFSNFQNQALAGGTPAMQAAGGSMTDILHTPFQQVSDDEKKAAMYALDQQQAEEMRHLTGMYKSLRPGSDPTTDTTWARDINQLNDRYSRAKAETLAQLQRSAYTNWANVQQGAAGQANALGSNVTGQQAAAVQSEIDRLNSQYNVDYQKKNALRQLLMTLGGNLLQNSWSKPQPLSIRIT